MKTRDDAVSKHLSPVCARPAGFKWQLATAPLISLGMILWIADSPPEIFKDTGGNSTGMHPGLIMLISFILTMLIQMFGVLLMRITTSRIISWQRAFIWSILSSAISVVLLSAVLWILIVIAFSGYK